MLGFDLGVIEAQKIRQRHQTAWLKKGPKLNSLTNFSFRKQPYSVVLEKQSPLQQKREENEKMVDSHSHRTSPSQHRSLLPQHQSLRSCRCLAFVLMTSPLLRPTHMTAEAIHPISSYATKLNKSLQHHYVCQHQLEFPAANNNDMRKQRLKQALANVEERRTLQQESSCTTTLLESAPITTTMYYHNEHGLSEIMNPSSDSSSSSSSYCQKSIFTSLGGEDDDNNDNNNNNNPLDSQPSRQTLGIWKTAAMFAFGAVLTVPFTEFVLDPLVLMWSMAFFGWLSYEEYDYPTTNQYQHQEEEDDYHDIEDEVRYPGCTDRQYFMTEEEQEAAVAEQHHRMASARRQFDAQSSPRGGMLATAGLQRRRSITFCGIQAGMIVLGDWMVRLVRTWMDIGNVNVNVNSNVDSLRKIIPSWLVAFSCPMQVASVICSMVIQFRIQQHQMDKHETTYGTRVNHFQPQHPIPYWLGYYMDHIAVLLPVALLVSQFLFESKWLWTTLTTAFSRHVGEGHPFQPLLGRMNEVLVR